MLIDFHTHAPGCERYREVPRTQLRVVQSLMYGELSHTRADYVTVGIHPLQQGVAELLAARPALELEEGNQIAIGECGWDLRSPLTLQEQTELVRWHISESERLQLPIVFHVVSAWHLLLSERKRYISRAKGVALPWIVHGFRKGAALATQLQQQGILISYHPCYHWRSGLPQVPFFLESDEEPISISHVYAALQSYWRASGMLNELEKQVETCFEHIFSLE